MNDTPLAQKIRRLIEADGPLTVAQYMAICLGDPEHGYYVTRDPIGVAGDFITAPEVSQMFGEVVGAWLIHAWRLAGSPAPARLVELGPGRGTLMTDILRMAKSVPEFFAALSVHLVEQSPVLRAQQAATLGAAGVEATWCADLAEVSSGPLFLVANEFFDALPVRQFVRIGNAWRERVIGLDTRGELVFGVGGEAPSFSHGEKVPAKRADEGVCRQGSYPQADAVRPHPSPSATPSPPGRGSLRPPLQPAFGSTSARGDSIDFLEIRPAAEAMVGEIASRIARDGGAALILDYGYERQGAGGGDTLQAVRNHRFADPLSAPGEVDLTAHVDFTALAVSAPEAGAMPHGPISQREFLLSLGLRERAAKLADSAGDTTRKALDAAVARLTGAEQMGELFKVLAITQRGLRVPPFPDPV